MNRQHVYVVDDERSVRDALGWLLKSVELPVSTHTDADSFLHCYSDELTGCLLLDVRMPGMSGLELQRILKHRNIEIPIIFLTGHGDVDMAVQTMKAGAFDFVQKPFNNQKLLDTVYAGLRQSKEKYIIRQKNFDKREKLSILTDREREVFQLAVDGYTNKVISIKFDISVKTVEAHRSNIMRKLNAKSLADLIKVDRRNQTDKITSPG